ncbi:P-loop containing nucleoside triphosphate hydrolase protein, partial [Backusella circina FSU 941]
SNEGWCSIYSSFIFSWAAPIMKIGYHRTIQDEDMMEIPTENLSKSILRKYQRNRTRINIFVSFGRVYFWSIMHQFIYGVIWSIVQFLPPLILTNVIKYIENPNEETVGVAYLYILELFVAQCIELLSVQKMLYLGRVLSVRIQTIVTGEVFAKSLRLRSRINEKEDGPNKNIKQQSRGNINNLLSVDAQKIGDLINYLYYSYSCPIRIVTSIWFLYRLLGNSALWGVLLMVICQPIIYLIGARFQYQHEAVMAATDKRLKVINELLSSIRIIKFFAWEGPFRKNINKIRGKELKAIRSRLMTFMWMVNACFFVPVVVMTVVFYIYTQEHKLTASVAFTSLALFNGLRTSIDDLPVNVSLLLQAMVSLKRVEKFLEEEEVMPLSEEFPLFKNESKATIGFINDASFSWEKPSTSADIVTDKVILKNLNLSFPPKKFSIICGPTGSGKTTLIASLLGETYCLKGSAILPRIIPDQKSPLGGAVSGIAYVAQTAWLQNCSIRDNILFGLPYDKERYESVLYVTALTRDLDIFEFGDATEIGEKGIALSGGQKQRVSIARAVYSQANTLILDDCLSAVDAHTAKHLYDYCLMGPLMKDRTVILVTHYVGLCMDGASYIVALKDGQVHGAGSPRALLKLGILGEGLSISKNNIKSNDKNEDEEKAKKSIPTISEYLNQKECKAECAKLVKEEQRANGSVSLSVYKSYIDASGGIYFGVFVIFLFLITQGSFLLHSYWIKVWAYAYDENTPFTGSMIRFCIHFYSTHIDSKTTLVEAYLNSRASMSTTYYFKVYVSIGFIALILTSLRSFVLFSGSLKASKHIHDQMLETILFAKVRFFDVTPIGRIINRFSFDMETIDQALIPNISFFLFYFTSTLCILLVISKITPIFIIPGTLIAPLFFIVCSYYLRSSRDLKRLHSVTRSPIYSQFNESMNGAMTIRAFGCQQRFLEENYVNLDNNNRPFIWLWAVNRYFSSMAEFLSSLVVLSTGVALVLARNWIDPGLAGLSLSYALTFTFQLCMIIRLYANNEMNMNSVERAFEYCNIEKETISNVQENKPVLNWPETGSLEIKNLVVKYSPDTPAVLNDISFKTKPFEKIGIVGRTGSGKSTLTLSIFRFMDPASGSIKIDGVDIQNVGLYDLRSRITIIPQDPVLFSGTIRSNLDPFGEHDDMELWTALKRSHLIDEQSIATEGEQNITLESFVVENGANWSQGQRQLISLARALVKRSNLIILDEATSNVDHCTDRKIQETIRTEFKHAAILCVAHRLLTIVDYDRILVLDQGKVVEFDTPYHLITQDGSAFQNMCIRSGEYNTLLQLAKNK